MKNNRIGAMLFTLILGSIIGLSFNATGAAGMDNTTQFVSCQK